MRSRGERARGGDWTRAIREDICSHRARLGETRDERSVEGTRKKPQVYGRTKRRRYDLSYKNPPLKRPSLNSGQAGRRPQIELWRKPRPTNILALGLWGSAKELDQAIGIIGDDAVDAGSDQLLHLGATIGGPGGHFQIVSM